LRLQNMIIDTNFVIDLLRGRKDAREKLEELKQKREPLIIPPGAVFELKVGKPGDEEIDKILGNLSRADLTLEIEKEAAIIRRNLEADGKPISSIDYLVAGTARNLNEKLLSRDAHFGRVENLRVERF